MSRMWTTNYIHPVFNFGIYKEHRKHKFLVHNLYNIRHYHISYIYLCILTILLYSVVQNIIKYNKIYNNLNVQVLNFRLKLLGFRLLQPLNKTPCKTSLQNNNLNDVLHKDFILGYKNCSNHEFLINQVPTGKSWFFVVSYVKRFFTFLLQFFYNF